MAAERPLVDASVRVRSNSCAPRLELVDAIRGFLGVDLRHAPVVVHLAAAHRVGGNAPASCPRPFTLPSAAAAPPSAMTVWLAEQRLADERDFGLLGARLDGGTQTGAAGADHDDVVIVTAQVGGCY